MRVGAFFLDYYVPMYLLKDLLGNE